MIKKSLVFGGITLFVVTLLVLAGCPDVVNDATRDDDPRQEDVSLTVQAGGPVIGLKLNTGTFKDEVQTDTSIQGAFKVYSSTTDYSLGTGATFKLNGTTLLTITPGTSHTIPNTGSYTVKIPGTAIVPPTGSVVGQGNVNGGAQGNIPVQTSANQTVGGENAIKVVLTNGSFVSEITGAQFEHDPSSGITTSNASDVVVSTDGKTATIYGTNLASVAQDVKIGIKAGALAGYPVVTASNVTVSALKAQQDIVITVSTAYSGDDFIKIALTNGAFASGVSIDDFTVTEGTNAITIAESDTLTVKDDAIAVIKVATVSTTGNFKLKIDKTAFDSTDDIVLVGDVTVTTTKQGTVEVTSAAADGGDNKLVITIAGGGKFASGVTYDKFVKVSATGSDNVDIKSDVIGLTNGNATATISLDPAFSGPNTITVEINRLAFDPNWPVIDADVTVVDPGT
jgi:hypothetical protein